MSPTARILAAMAVACAATPAIAQQTADTPTSRAEISAQLDTRFARLDRDKDGSFTKAEFIAAQKEGQQQIASRLSAMLTQEFAALDANKDGTIVSAEIPARPGKTPADAAAMFKTIDANGDGKVSKEEYLVPSTRVRPAATPDAQIARFDGNKDGKVSLAEFKAGPLANFDAADGNKDGIVSVEEKKKILAQRGR